MSDERNGCEFDPDDLQVVVRKLVPGKLEALTPAVEEVMAQARQMECSQGKEFEIETALREALANAIRHGCGNDPDKQVEVCVACDPARGMLIVVRDPGPGFDPALDPEPGARPERVPPPRPRHLPDQPADGRGLLRQGRHRDPDAEALTWRARPMTPAARRRALIAAGRDPGRAGARSRAAAAAAGAGNRDGARAARLRGCRDLRDLPRGRGQALARLAARARDAEARRAHRAGRLRGPQLRAPGRRHDVLAPRRPLLRPHRRARTASSPSSASPTCSASRRSSSTCSSCPAAGCRRSASPGTAGRSARAGSASSTCTRRSTCPRPTCCTGRSPRRTGTPSAPSATRRTCARATTLADAELQDHLPS